MKRPIERETKAAILITLMIGAAIFAWVITEVMK